MWSIAKPVETRKADISRVCVKASAAFGRRRLHRNTDYIDCPALSFLFSLPFSFFLFFFHLDILDGQRGKQKLA